MKKQSFSKILDATKQKGDPHQYENFIKHCWGYHDRSNLNGANAETFSVLMLSESRPRIPKLSHLDYLIEVKGHLSKAIDNFLTNKKLYESEKFILLEMKDRLPYATNSNDLHSIIELSDSILERYSKL